MYTIAAPDVLVGVGGVSMSLILHMPTAEEGEAIVLAIRKGLTLEILFRGALRSYQADTRGLAAAKQPKIAILELKKMAKSGRWFSSQGDRGSYLAL